MDKPDGVKVGFWITLAICAVSVLAVVGMAVHLGVQPLAEMDDVSTISSFGIPCLVIPVAAMPARRGGCVLILLAILAGVAGLMGVGAAFRQWNFNLQELSLSGIPRKCGTRASLSPDLVLMPFAFALLAVLLGCVALVRAGIEKANAPHVRTWGDLPLSALGLSPAGQRWAARQGIISVDQVCHLREDDLRAGNGINEEVLRELRKKLAARGLGLKGE